MLANETEQPLEQKKKALKDNLAQVGMLSNATAKIIDSVGSTNSNPSMFLSNTTRWLVVQKLVIQRYNQWGSEYRTSPVFKWLKLSFVWIKPAQMLIVGHLNYDIEGFFLETYFLELTLDF